MGYFSTDRVVQVLGSLRGSVRKVTDVVELRKPKRFDLEGLQVLRQTDDFTSVAPRHVEERTEYGPMEYRRGEFQHYLVKNSHLVGRGRRPKYLHLVYELESPHDVRTDYYPVISLPGILTSTNLMRTRNDGGDFKVLDNDTSLANRLARSGMRLFLANPPYCRRLDQRYVSRKLGIANPFMPALCFDDLVRYLKVYIDFITDYTGSSKVVLLDYSLGAMTADAYAGSADQLFGDGRSLDDRIAGLINIAGPSKLDDQPTIRQLRGYNLIAGVLPATPIDPLKVFGKRFVTVSAALAMVPRFVLPHVPVLKDLYDFENMEPAETAALINMLNYGTEAITPGMLFQMVEIMANDPRGFVSLDRRIDYLGNMGRISVPYLSISGAVDTLAPPENMRLGFDSLGTPGDQKRFEVVNGASHLGLLVRRRPMERVADLCVRFMDEFGRKAA